MLEDLLKTPVAPATAAKRTGYTFTQEYAPHDPKTVNITATTTEALQDDNAIKAFILANGGIIPEGYTARLVEARHNTAAWTRDNPEDNATTRGTWFYRFTIEPVKETRESAVNDLIKAIEKRKPATKKAKPVTDVFHLLIGEPQIGKMDGDGTAGIVQTFLDGIQAAGERYTHTPATHVHIAWLGDCIEGNQSQNGRNMWRTELTVTEQTRLLRRLMLHAIDHFIDLGAPNISMDAVNGNHDQVQRFQETRADDGHATEAAIALSDALQLNPARYGGVSIYVPEKDADHIVRQIGNTTFVMLHGHQFTRGKSMEWWKGQTFNNQTAGAATIMFHGHEHEFSIKSKRDRLAICVPTLEAESTWWKHRTGDVGKRGSLVLTTTNGTFANMEIV
jgi:predicted phosphodiesterase